MKLIATNRRASFDYELGDRYEAGLVLLGSEVKSLRNRAAGIGEAWACIIHGEAFIEGMRISVLDHAAYGHTNVTASPTTNCCTNTARNHREHGTMRCWGLF